MIKAYLIEIDYIPGQPTGYEATIKEGIAGAGGIVATGIGYDETQAILNAAKLLNAAKQLAGHEHEHERRNCVLCGEAAYEHPKGGWVDISGKSVEVAEMHGDFKPLYGTSDIEVGEGFVHAQCGIDAGWEVS